MATIKIFDVNGIKELSCFDTVDNVPYLVEEENIDDTPEERDPFEDE